MSWVAIFVLSTSRRTICPPVTSLRNGSRFHATHTIREAVRDLKNVFDEGLIQNYMENPWYFNIKTMQQINLT